jgi:hypothetical protein
MTISKTDFMAYIDAPRHLWAIKNTKLIGNELDSFVQHLFEQGYQVEAYADRYIREILLQKYGINDSETDKYHSTSERCR